MTGYIIIPGGVVLHIGVRLCPTPMCKTTTLQGGILHTWLNWFCYM